MKKKYFIVLLILVVIIFFSLEFYYLKANSRPNKVSKLETYTIPSVEKVFINGVIEPVRSQDIYIDASKGKLNNTYVKNEQVVKKGDKLFDYRNASVTDQIEQVTSQIDTYDKQKKQLQENKQIAEAKLANLKTQNSNQTNLVVDGTMVEEPKTSLESEINSYKDQMSSIDNQISTSESQISSLKKKEYCVESAPIDGKIILDEKGTNSQSPYIIIDSMDYYVEGMVNEKDRAKLRVNLTTDILILATDKTVTGKITAIGDIPVTSGDGAVTSSVSSAAGGTSNISNYAVKINLDSQKGLCYGYHIQAVAKLLQNGYEVPKGAIMQENSNRYVYLVVNKRLVKQTVTCLESEGGKMYVTGGLKENDEIVKNPTSEMKEGSAIE